MASTQSAAFSQDEAAEEVLRELEQDQLVVPAPQAIPVSAVPSAVRLRVCSKQPPCPLTRSMILARHLAQQTASHEQAIADEAGAELGYLDGDCRRKHIHWTHVRTNCVTDKQPESFSRAQFWQHMMKVYKEVYPESASKSDSILMFGFSGLA